VKVDAFHYFERIAAYDNVCNPMNFGAKGDGKTNDTSAVQAAINSCWGHGSSAQLLFPSDKTFLVSPLYITEKCNDCAFTISSGATLLVSNDRSAWPSNQQFLYISGQTNFVFEGPGKINGQGQVWWQNSGDFRPEIMYARDSSNVVITNMQIENCPAHCLELSTDSTEIFGIDIENPYGEAPNTDGIDVHGQPFYIHDSTINTGDDNVAMHANDTLVENCHFGAGHGASIGSIGSGVWLTNITVQNIVFDTTHQAARIKVHNDASSGRLWGVTYRNLTMTDVGRTVIVTEYYDGPQNETCHYVIEDITFESITATVNADYSDVGEILCQPTSPCKSITLKDITITGGNPEWVCSEAQVSASNVSPAVHCNN
jgi:polygalacturonase